MLEQAAPDTPTKTSEMNKVELFGHIVGLLPFVSFLLMWIWLPLCVYDDNDIVIGPRWVMHFGGDDLATIQIPLCIIAGVSSVIAGRKGRRRWTIFEGVWCLCASFLLFVFYIMQFGFGSNSLSNYRNTCVQVNQYVFFTSRA